MQLQETASSGPRVVKNWGAFPGFGLPWGNVLKENRSPGPTSDRWVLRKPQSARLIPEAQSRLPEHVAILEHDHRRFAVVRDAGRQG